jgi:putative ABC transport system permease protein
MAASVTLIDGVHDPREPQAARCVAGQGYFATLRMPVLRGRDFLPADRPGSRPVVVINQRLAVMLGIEQDAIGKHLDGLASPVATDQDPADGHRTGSEIVGIVGDSRNRDVREPALPMAYVPFDQQPSDGVDLLIRYRGAAGELERSVRRIVQSQAPGYRVPDAISMELRRDRLLSQDRVLAFLSGLFGALGTALALVGIYGLIAYSVMRRTREIGIRVSIGAQRWQVVWLFMRESAMLVCLGVLLGVPLALLLAGFVKKMLFELSPWSALDIGATVALLMACGLAAAWLPSSKASRVEPVQALRYE